MRQGMTVEATAERRRRPQAGIELYRRIAGSISHQVAPAGDCGTKLSESPSALDDGASPVPGERAEEGQLRDWCDCQESALVVKAIKYRLSQAEKAGVE